MILAASQDESRSREDSGSEVRSALCEQVAGDVLQNPVAH